jgi:hypothetical protein
MKRSSLLFPLLLLSVILSSCAEQAAMPGRAFEGTITQIIKVPGLANAMGGEAGGGGAMMAAASNVNMKIYAREDKLAYEMAVMGGLFKIKTIIDRSSRTITMLMPNKQAFVTDLRSMDSMRKIIDDSLNTGNHLDSLAQNIPKPTGKKMEINGFEVEEYVSKVEGMDVQMWMTSDPRMQFYEIIQDAMLGRQRTGMGGIEEAFAMLMPLSKGKIPVQLTAKLNGEIFATSELTKIEEMELDDEIFAIPAGYKIIKGAPGSMNSSSSSDSVMDAIDSVASTDTTSTFRTGKP